MWGCDPCVHVVGGWASRCLATFECWLRFRGVGDAVLGICMSFARFFMGWNTLSGDVRMTPIPCPRHE